MFAVSAPILTAQELLPPKATATLKKARAAAEKGLLARSRSLYQKADKLIGEPSFEVQVGLSRLHLLRGEQKEGLATARRALDLARDPVQKAVSLNQVGIGHWQLAFVGEPDPSGTGSVPRLKSRDAHLEQAETAFRRSIEVSAERFPSPFFNLAETLYAMGRVPDATQAIERYLATAPPEGVTERVRRLESCLRLLASQSAEEPVRKVGDDFVTRPTKIAGGVPRYTVAARQKRIMGVVVLESVIDREGEVICVRPLLGLPLGLTQVAIDTLQSWRFEPATLDGEPVPVFYNLTINFRLSR